LGVVTTWETMEWAEYLDRVHTDPPHIFLMGWMADYPDPDSFLRVGLRLHSKWRHEAYDELLERARRATEQEERMDVYRQADRILVEEAVVLPLCYGQQQLLIKPWVRRYPVAAEHFVFWKDVIIEPH
jgi:ABC-type oligopeptide transport system substrate-binding subunit